MRPDPKYLGQSKRFWASVRTVGEFLGYSTRGQSSVLSPSISDIEKCVRKAWFWQENGR
jgi:hypothetical protein